MELMGWLNAAFFPVTQPAVAAATTTTNFTGKSKSASSQKQTQTQNAAAAGLPSIDDGEEEESEPTTNFVCKSASLFEQKR